MELKDVILSTLAEMENEVPSKAPKQETIIKKKSSPAPVIEVKSEKISKEI